LVDCGYEIRNEFLLDAMTLRDVAEKIFEDGDMPPKPPVPSMYEIVLRNVMARRLQNAWISYNFYRREDEEINKSFHYNQA
jgi:hypothetical protein